MLLLNFKGGQIPWTGSSADHSLSAKTREASLDMEARAEEHNRPETVPKIRNLKSEDIFE